MYQVDQGLMTLATFDSEDAAYTWAARDLNARWHNEAKEYADSSCHLKDIDLESVESIGLLWNNWLPIRDAGDNWLLIESTLNPATLTDGELII
jgi:hypothetical protein